MGIIYLLSTIILIVTFILIKKSEKEMNVLSTISISLGLILSYNTFICYLLTFFAIAINLYLLSLINLFISLLFACNIAKKKEMQQYSFHKIDIVYIFILALILLIVTWINAGFPFNIKYVMGDSSVHYLASRMFAESDAFLIANANPDALYGTLERMRPAAYTNTGLLIKSLASSSNFISYIQIFIWYDIGILFLIGFSIYTAMSNMAKTKEHRFWAFIVSIICTLGYPLNATLFGFEYMSTGLFIICVILNVMQLYKTDAIKFTWSNIFFFCP